MEQGDDADVCFSIEKDKTRICAHSFVLTSRSQYFAAMLRSESKDGGKREFTLEHVSHLVLKTILVFLYSGKACLTRESLFDVAAKAQEYQLDSLIPKCVEFCRDYLSVDNCVGWLVTADR